MTMFKQKRIDYHAPLFKDRFYHIYNRSVGKDVLFYNNENYKYFLEKYSKYLDGIVNTYSFCLLPNHFHFLIRPTIEDQEQISQQFQRFFISYSMSVNKEQERSGNLFQKNFKRKIIEDESYLKSVVYYIHANPLHHKLRNDFENYPYSSYQIILSNKPTRLKRQDVIEWFGSREQFVEFHRDLKSYLFDESYAIEK